MYRCSNDTYCTDTEFFGSLEDFQAFCLESYGDEPDLRLNGNDYVQDGGDEDGFLVLELVTAP